MRAVAVAWRMRVVAAACELHACAVLLASGLGFQQGRHLSSSPLAQDLTGWAPNTSTVPAVLPESLLSLAAQPAPKPPPKPRSTMATASTAMAVYCVRRGGSCACAPPCHEQEGGARCTYVWRACFDALRHSQSACSCPAGDRQWCGLGMGHVAHGIRFQCAGGLGRGRLVVQAQGGAWVCWTVGIRHGMPASQCVRALSLRGRGLGVSPLPPGPLPRRSFYRQHPSPSWDSRRCRSCAAARCWWWACSWPSHGG